MKILLINSNPVVSRLTALSARKENIRLDEIESISELKGDNYNIIFVDYDSFTQKVADYLKESKVKRKAYFRTQQDGTIDEIFNIEIVKPFLPSEVSSIIRETKMELEDGEKDLVKESIELDELISTKKDDLAPIQEEPKEILKSEEKISLTQNEKELQEEIASLSSPLEDIEKDLKDNSSVNFILQDDKKEKEEKKIDLPIKDEVKESVNFVLQEEKENKKDESKDTIVNSELFELDTEDDKKSKNNKDEVENLFVLDNEKVNITAHDTILDFDKESENNLVLEAIEEPKNNKTEAKKEDKTKVLDKEEITTIKNLLDNDKTSSEELTIDDIIENSTPPLEEKPHKKDKKHKKKSKKKKEKDTAVRVIKDTIKAMPVEELRQLLRGTKIHITIEFPNE